MALRRRARRRDEMTIIVHEGGMVSCYIETEESRRAEQFHQEWWNSLSPEEQDAHLKWEQEETAKWLAWADDQHAARETEETL